MCFMAKNANDDALNCEQNLPGVIRQDGGKFCRCVRNEV